MSDLEGLIRDVRKEWSSSEAGTIGGDVLALCDAAEKVSTDGGLAMKAGAQMTQRAIAAEAELERWKVKYQTLWDVEVTNARADVHRLHRLLAEPFELLREHQEVHGTAAGRGDSGRREDGPAQSWRERRDAFIAAVPDELAPNCTHESSSGVDQTEGPEKVWRCDSCGWLHRVVTGSDGISRDVDAMSARFDGTAS